MHKTDMCQIISLGVKSNNPEYRIVGLRFQKRKAKKQKAKYPKALEGSAGKSAGIDHCILNMDMKLIDLSSMLHKGSHITLREGIF
jgi:hypothetical protein